MYKVRFAGGRVASELQLIDNLSPIKYLQLQSKTFNHTDPFRLDTCFGLRQSWVRSGGRPRPGGLRTYCPWRTSAPPHWPRTGSGPCWPGTAGTASRSSCSTLRAPHWSQAGCARWWDSPYRAGNWNVRRGDELSWWLGSFIMLCARFLLLSPTVTSTVL